jgi:flavodoxin
MERAVVFYSAQGNSALAAKALAGKLGARLVELKESKPRVLDPMGFMKAGFQASMRVRSKLMGMPWQDVVGCSELHIITPIWAARPAPAVNAFLAKCDFKGKAVTLYTVQADPQANAEDARSAMAAAVKRLGGTVKAAHGLVGAAPGKGVNEELALRICSL